MTMGDYIQELYNILQSTGRKVLDSAGKISNMKASKKANLEYRKYKAQNLSEVEKDYLNAIKQLDKEYNDKFASKYGKGLIGAGHALHKAYTAPIVQVLRLGSFLPGKFGDWAKDPKKREKIADIIYAVFMLFYGGIHAKHGISELLAHHGIDGATFATTVIDAAKSGKSLKDVVSAGIAMVGGLET